MLRPAANIVRAKKREISVRYRNGKRPISMAAIRVAEIDRLLVHRYGPRLPDDDSGRDDARLMVHHLAQISGDPFERIAAWIALRSPWMSLHDAERLTAAAITKPLRWRSASLGAAFRLTDVERTELRIKTIAPIDVTKTELLKRRKQRNREQKASKRRAGGAVSREQYEVSAAGHGQPWIAAGVSRATWYRKQGARLSQ